MQVLYVEFFNTGKCGRTGCAFFPFSTDVELRSIKSHIALQRKYGDYENYTVYDYDTASKLFLAGSLVIKDVE